MAVVTNEGIVGRVLRTTANTSDIVTITDLLSAVDSIVERSRARGVVEGVNENTCSLRYTLRTDDIQPGDVLVSSGLGGIFPKGIPVGTVSKVNRKPFGISQDVEVRPTVDFTKLEEVLIITNTPVALATGNETHGDSEKIPEKSPDKSTEKPTDKASEKNPEKAPKKAQESNPAAFHFLSPCEAQKVKLVPVEETLPCSLGMLS